MKLLSISDLEARWCYSRAGIHRMATRSNFPAPIAIVSKGRIKIYQEADIEAYERDKPWLFDVRQKERRQHLYGLLNQANENPERREAVLKHAFGQEAKNWVSK